MLRPNLHVVAILTDTYRTNSNSGSSRRGFKEGEQQDKR